MPVVIFEGPYLDKDKKAYLVSEFTRIICETVNVPPQAVVALIKENKTENIGNCGKLLCEKVGKPPAEPQ